MVFLEIYNSFIDIIFSISNFMKEKNSIDILKSLVSFDTTSYRSNLELVEFIKQYLKSFKIESELIYDESKTKANLYATIGPKNNGGVILSGHTDVVPVADQTWDSDPFNLIRKDDRLLGRGSADMKGFLALVLSRVPKMIEVNLSKPIHLAFSYDEEIGCVGVHRMLDIIEKKPYKPSFCIVGEPTGMEVVVGHKGKSGYNVNVRGLPCHSGHAPNGVNAINFAAKLILHISELAIDKSINGPFDYDYEIPYTTLHTGIVSGGKALNIVPDLCKFEFEIRHISKDDPNELLNKIKNYTLENLIPDMHNISKETGIYIEENVSYPGFLVSQDSQNVKYIKELLNNNIHKKVIFGSEAGLFNNRLKLPTVVCGPGSINQAHKPNEYISLNQLEKGGQFLDRLIASLNNA